MPLLYINLTKLITRIFSYILSATWACIIVYTSFAQNGGRNSFEYLNIPVSAHIAGVGGINTSIYDCDINLVSQNPALLLDTMNGQLALNYIPYFSNIKATSVTYAHTFKKAGIFATSLFYIDYGKITERDDGGNYIGEFKPYDMAVTISKSHTIGVFTLGSNLKYAYSHLYAGYSAHGIFVDAGGIFRHPHNDLTVSLVIKNTGIVFNKYVKNSKHGMPFDVQAGITYKFEHMPMRLSVMAHHLHQPDIVYLDTLRSRKIDLNGNVIIEKKKVLDLLGTHFVVGPEFLLSKNFHLRFGYNYIRRYEMRLQDKTGATGFSWGIAIGVKTFRFEFSRAYYHVSKGRNWVTMLYDLNSINRKSKRTM